METRRGSMMGLLERCITQLANRRLKLAFTRAQLENVVKGLEGIVSVRQFKELRAWWCILCAAFLRCS